jgi:hypothetical protein
MFMIDYSFPNFISSAFKIDFKTDAVGRTDVTACLREARQNTPKICPFSLFFLKLFTHLKRIYQENSESYSNIIIS